MYRAVLLDALFAALHGLGNCTRPWKLRYCLVTEPDWFCETAPAKSLTALHFRIHNSPFDMTPGLAGINDLGADVER